MTELVTSMTDSLGRVTNFVYDGSNSNIALANLTSITELAETSNPLTTNFSWDTVAELFDEIQTITDPISRATSFTIDHATGNVTGVTDAMNRTTTFAFNSAGQVISVQDALQNPPTQFGYSPSAPTLGDLASVRDALGNVSKFVTDSVGRTTSVTSPLRETTTYATNNTTWHWTPPLGGSWDIQQCNSGGSCIEVNSDWASGLMVWSKDKRGIKTTPTYDTLQRVTNLEFNSNGVSGLKTSNIAYNYDSADRVLTMTDTGGANPNTESFTYDLLDDVLTATSAEGTVTYTRDAVGRIQALKNAALAPIGYRLDADNEVTAVINNGLTASATYDSDGRRTCLSAFGTVQRPSYDSDSRVTGINYGSQAGICPNLSSNLGSLSYSYDNDSRITGVGGSLASVSVPAAVSAAYDGTNQVTKWNLVAARDDAANNLTRDPSNSASYEWDERDWLASADSPSYLFYYDALGRRESFFDFSSTVTYLYDAAMAVQAASSNTSVAPRHNYVTMPNGEVLADYVTSGPPRRFMSRCTISWARQSGWWTAAAHSPVASAMSRSANPRRVEHPPRFPIFLPLWSTIQAPAFITPSPATTARPYSASSPRTRCSSRAASSIYLDTSVMIRLTSGIPGAPN
jgi:YD repeat-containing protein